MNKFEKAIQESLVSMQAAPSEALRSRIMENADIGIDIMPVYRRRIPVRAAVLAAIITALVLTTAFAGYAVGSYFGAFDRLREILGGERSDMLHPVGIGTVVGEHVTDAGFRVELVAVGVFDSVVDLYINLEDLEGNRLDDDEIFIWTSVFPTAPRRGGMLSQPPEIISRTADGIVTFRSRHVFGNTVIGQELDFSLHAIWYNRTAEEIEIALDLGALTEYTAAAVFSGIPVLPVRTHALSIEPPEGFEHILPAGISSVGIIDGKLHIQEVHEFPSIPSTRGGGQLRLVDPQGELVTPSIGADGQPMSVNFTVDTLGNPTTPTTANPALGPRFWEAVYDIDMGRISEYRLVAWFTTWDEIELGWSIRFEVEYEERALVADGLDIYIACCSAVLSEVRVSPFSVRLSLLATPLPDVANPPSVTINTSDVAVDIGTFWTTFMIFPPDIEGGSGIPGMPIGLNIVLDLDTDFLDLDTVVSIEVAGATIELR